MQFLQLGQLAVPQGSQYRPGPHESQVPGIHASAHSPVAKMQKFGAQSSCDVQNWLPLEADVTDFTLLDPLDVLVLDDPPLPPPPGSSRTTPPPQPAARTTSTNEVRSQVMRAGYVSPSAEASAGNLSRP
jgi:hypothetical protein